MNREDYIAECAEYLRQLKAQDHAIYSQKETAALLKHLRHIKDHLEGAERETRLMLGQEIGKRAYRTGLEPVALRELRKSVLHALALNRQAIEDLDHYRKRHKPRKYRLARSAVNLAHAHFVDGKQGEITDLANDILAAAGVNDAFPAERTITNWLASIKASNLPPSN